MISNAMLRIKLLSSIGALFMLLYSCSSFATDTKTYPGSICIVGSIDSILNPLKQKPSYWSGGLLNRVASPYYDTETLDVVCPLVRDNYSSTDALGWAIVWISQPQNVSSTCTFYSMGEFANGNDTLNPPTTLTTQGKGKMSFGFWGQDSAAAGNYVVECTLGPNALLSQIMWSETGETDYE